MPPPPQSGASFVDLFGRPDTVLGLGEGWDMWGIRNQDFSLAPATDGFIRGGAFTYAGHANVIASRRFRSPVFRIGANGRWAQPGAEPESSAVLGIAANDDLLHNMLQLSASRKGWSLSVRRDGRPIRYITGGEFSPLLEVNRNYTFEITIANQGQVIVRVPGDTETVKVGTKGLDGDRGYWGLYTDKDKFPIRTAFSFDSVWAGEDGQTLSPTPEPNTS